MNTVNNLDDYRHKLIDKIIGAESLEEIKWLLSGAVNDLKDHELNGHLMDRFIDKSIDQLNGLGLLHADIKIGLNSKFAKTQLELIKRHSAEENRSDV
jgi:hypothetical protein